MDDNRACRWVSSIYGLRTMNQPEPDDFDEILIENRATWSHSERIKVFFQSAIKPVLKFWLYRIKKHPVDTVMCLVSDRVVLGFTAGWIFGYSYALEQVLTFLGVAQ